MNVILSLLLISLLTMNFSTASLGFAKTTQDLNNKVQALGRKAPNLKRKIIKMALAAYNKANATGAVHKPILTVIDYSLPSSKERMWVFDLRNNTLLYNTFVAHGKNSGATTPTHFSNANSSKETSLGTFVTHDTYIGGKGISLNLEGLEAGFNDNAYNRRVVIHGAWYVEPGFIKSAGQAGRSWGCPAVAQSIAKPIINTLKGGSVVFSYYPDKNYLSHTHYANIA
ncbi:MAG: hypothetical protein A3E88_06980 [Legionellales bacterium RIFCSPHIGHO2_12_FULL_35_11]|nr:MAG: hypothetical protein A3E88_06980 [Legionellales bacterium RIFCSPHIGHO2_12_FULL_35_11]